MKLFISVLMVLSIIACQKDPATPVPQEPVIIKIPVHEPCDTSNGRADAVKQSTVWIGGGICRPYFFAGHKYWIVEFTTCSPTGDIREHLQMGGMPDISPQGNYKVVSPGTTALPENTVGSTYATLLGDGDVLEDLYRPDTSLTDNYFIIDKWDKAAKRAEGRFSVTYKIVGTKSNPGNPSAFLLRSGTFWVSISG